MTSTTRQEGTPAMIETAAATVTDVTAAEWEAYRIESHRRTALTQREWADTGAHGYTHKPRLVSLPGWHVFPGMILPARFSNRVADLGLGDVRVVGRAQSAAEYRHAPWNILVESVETGERAVLRTRTYDSHEVHAYVPSYMTSRDAFHARYEGALSYADERYDSTG